jgi:predicted metal-binding transcription factor (methanogenesis marker protein 9)
MRTNPQKIQKPDWLVQVILLKASLSQDEYIKYPERLRVRIIMIMILV